MVTKSRKGGTRTAGVGEAVYAVLVRGQNLPLCAADIAEETGFTRTQVINTINNLKIKNDITSPQRGWYIFKGPKEGGQTKAVTVGAKAVVMGMLPDGRVLLTIDGVLYAATEAKLA